MPPSGPPPSGPPPSGPPPSGPPPEYLTRGPERPRRRGRVGTWLAAGGVVGAVALVGGAAWAAWWWFDSGPQPAQALPAGTLGYVAIDLDPEGAQKVEALRTLQKFPALREELDMDAEDDLRRRIFEEIQAESGCEGLDYDADIEPWLGDRMAIAAVEGAEGPAPVFVLQVDDATAAEDGVAALGECAGEEIGFAVEGDWGVIAETDEFAQGVVDEAADASLADDEQFQRWTGEAGDAGVMSAYVAAEAGSYLADLAGELADPFGMGALPGEAMPFGYDDGYEGSYEPLPGLDGEELDPELLEGALADFGGAAATLRFDDGAVELEVAGNAGASQAMVYSDDGVGDLVSGLPGDTGAVFAVAFAEGWFGQVLEQAEQASGLSADQMLAEMSAMTGMELPEDAETLAGEALAVAVGGDFDPEAFFSSPDGSGLPIGVKIQGEADEIESVLDKMHGLGDSGAVLVSDSADGYVAIGPDDTYRSRLLDDGDLGDSDVFRDVVREDDASSLMFVNFDAGDWLANMAGDDDTARENLEPLAGVGLSGWLEGEGDDAVTHGVLRLTTN